MPATGNRWAKGSKNPADFTGKQGIALRQELAAKKAAEDLDPVAEYKRGYQAGLDSGMQRGVSQGWDAAIEFVEQAGYVRYDRESDVLHRLTDAEFDALGDEPGDDAEAAE